MIERLRQALRRFEGRLARWLVRVRRRSSRPVRIVLGILLTLFGLLGFLPVVGFWMIPIGLSILAIDFPPLRRLARRLRARRPGRDGEREGDGPPEAGKERETTKG